MSLKDGSETARLITGNDWKKGKVTLLVIAMSNFCAWCCMSLLAPFFPIEAAKKGVSETVIGFIFSCSELVIFLSSPLFGYLFSNSNPRFFYIAGIFVFGCCTVLFGWLNRSPPGIPFIAICFAVRIVQALGTASFLTSTFAIAGSSFPDRIGTITSLYVSSLFLFLKGLLEMITGAGFMIGPTIGGSLYELGGFGLPFWVLGCCVFICSCASCVVLPQQNYITSDTGRSSMQLYRSPLVWLGSACLLVSLTSITVYIPVYAQHMAQFNLRQSVIGLLFIIPPGSYSVTTPIWGCLLDRNVPAIPLMFIGLICAAVSALFFGPAPFFTFMKPMLWSTILASTFFGLSIAPILVSSMRCIVQGARNLGFKDDSCMFSLVGGVISAANSLGTFIGPTIGGVATEKFGFGWTLTIASGILLLPIFISSPYICCIFKRWLETRSEKKDKNTEFHLNIQRPQRDHIHYSPGYH